jgi:hypothetical protein
MDTSARAWLGQRGGPPAGIQFSVTRMDEPGIDPRNLVMQI